MKTVTGVPTTVIGPATLYLGDCIAVMKTMADCSVDAIVTDPPYHLTTGKKGGTGMASVNLNTPAGRARISTGFMGKAWDGGDIAHSVEMWAEALRVLKPGGQLLAFAGSRTYHRMACAIEDAGFEIRDQIMWVYSTGFPKSHNGEWGGTALKPAHEPIAMARKPLIGTVEANWAAHGTGALNIDGCRIGVGEIVSGGGKSARGNGGVYGNGIAEESAQPHIDGRWPANLIHDGSPEVLALFPESVSGSMSAGTLRAAQDGPGSVCYGTYGGNATSAAITGSAGSAARFFYCAKASRTDRNDGLQNSAAPAVGTEATMREREDADWPARNGNHHPTVKPTDLMAYLCRLVTPPGGTVLDCFMGSGSTGKAAVREGFKFIGIDMTPEYVDIARARITHEIAEVERAKAQGRLFSDSVQRVDAVLNPPVLPQMSLFSEAA